MLESNLYAGRQDIPKNLEDLAYGVSVTDACLDWETTEETLLQLNSQVSKVLRARA